MSVLVLNQKSLTLSSYSYSDALLLQEKLFQTGEKIKEKTLPLLLKGFLGHLYMVLNSPLD